VSFMAVAGQAFFDSEERIRTLREAVLPWLGTPFLERCGRNARAGVCADCTWVAAPLQRLGAIGAVPWPARYASRGGGEKMLGVLLGVLEQTERLARIWSRDEGLAERDVHLLLRAGDVLVLSTGSRLHHLALALDAGTVAHSWSGLIQLSSSMDHRALWYAIYRPIVT
jgi:hypothetical protein